MTLVWLIYFSFAELSSLGPSKASSCILISEEANTENYSGDYACAPMHEAIFRFVRYVWDSASHDNIIAFGTILIALFTYILYRSTNKLWDAGERQLRHLEDTAQRQLRAYIIAKVDDVDVEQINGSEGEAMVSVKIAIKNTGQTPAHDLRIVSKAELLRHPVKMPNFTLISGPDPSVSVLGAGEPIASECNTLFDGNAMMCAEESELSKKRIYIWGTVTYRDVFGGDHWTNFCSSLIFRESEYVVHASEHHNDAS
jgi:hypothetical protein